MSAENNSSADSADIGEALVAALGFEPTEGRKLGRKSAATSPGDSGDGSPSVDDAFSLVTTGSAASEQDSLDGAALGDSAELEIDISDQNNGSSSSAPATSVEAVAAVASSGGEAGIAAASGATAPADAGAATQNRSNRSRKSRKRRNRSNNSNTNKSKSSGPPKMADGPKSAQNGGDASDEPVVSSDEIKSAAKPSVSSKAGDKPAADQADVTKTVLPGTDSPVDKSPAEADAGSTSTSAKAGAKQTEANTAGGGSPSSRGVAEAAATTTEIGATSQVGSAAEKAAGAHDKTPAVSEAPAGQPAAKSPAKSDSAETTKRVASAVADAAKPAVSGSVNGAAAKAAERAQQSIAEQAAVTGDLQDIIGTSSEQPQPPPPSAADAITVMEQAAPATADGSVAVDDGLGTVPTSPPTMPASGVSAAAASVSVVATPAEAKAADTVAKKTAAAPTEQIPVAEQLPQQAEARADTVKVDSSPGKHAAEKQALELKADEPPQVPAVEPKPVVVKPSGVRLPAFPNVLRRKRRVQARKVRRVVRHIDPWSVLTFSVLFHLCVFAALLLASVLVWNAAEAAGTIENMEAFILDLGDYETFEIKGDVVFRAAVAIAGVLTLASSVLLVLLTVVFNLISDLVGGIRLTVIEEETVRVRRKKKS